MGILDVFKKKTTENDNIPKFDYGKATEVIFEKMDVAREKLGHVNILITVGNASKYIALEAEKSGFDLNNIYSYNNNIEAINKLKEIVKENDYILIKASNGMKFIEIYECLKEFLK